MNPVLLDFNEYSKSFHQFLLQLVTEDEKDSQPEAEEADKAEKEVAEAEKEVAEAAIASDQLKE